MLVINVVIVRQVDDRQPGFVECKLTDRFGREWFFMEKGPVVSPGPLDRRRPYPQPGIIACHVITRGYDEKGREVATIDTYAPWGLESVEGMARFHIFADQLKGLDGR